LFAQKRRGTVVRLNQRQVFTRISTFQVEVADPVEGNIDFEKVITRPLTGDDKMDELEWIAMNGIQNIVGLKFLSCRLSYDVC
jgi:hypothetical protein